MSIEIPDEAIVRLMTVLNEGEHPDAVDERLPGWGLKLREIGRRGLEDVAPIMFEAWAESRVEDVTKALKLAAAAGVAYPETRARELLGLLGERT